VRRPDTTRSFWHIALPFRANSRHDQRGNREFITQRQQFDDKG
jgi:hypothetical protein